MKKLMSFVWVCLMSISILSAQGVEEVTLVVSGDGATKEEATHVALRSAIEQAFGCFVSANTEILNDSVVKDEIVTISNGSISSYEEINVTELDSALLSITLRATVSVNKLISYAKSKGSSCELSGALLTQEKRMLEMNIANTKKTLNHLFTLVNEFVEKNDLYTYTLDIQNVKMNGFVTAWLTCQENENGKNLKKMINDYLSAISIGRDQVQHLREIGFEAPRLCYKWCTYADFSCISKDLRNSIVKNIDRRACVLFADNLGFVYPVTPKLEVYTKWGDDVFNFYITEEDREGYSEFSQIIFLQIPDQNMAALTNIEVVPFSDSRFNKLHQALVDQSVDYYYEHLKNKAYIHLLKFSEEDVYYYVCKQGLYFFIENRCLPAKLILKNNSEETIKEVIEYYEKHARYWRSLGANLDTYAPPVGGFKAGNSVLEEICEIIEQLTKGENIHYSGWTPDWNKDYFANRSTISE